jgi:acyl carrier protein
MENEVLKQLQKYIAAILDNDSITISENTIFDELEYWNSLSYRELIAYLENEFNIKISIKEILSCVNINDVIKLINKKTINTNDKQ